MKGMERDFSEAVFNNERQKLEYAWFHLQEVTRKPTAAELLNRDNTLWPSDSFIRDVFLNHHAEYKQEYARIRQSLPVGWISGDHTFKVRQLTLYSTGDGGFSSMSVVGGKKNKKGKIDRFSVKMAIFKEKKVRSSEVNPACRRKK